MDARVEHVGSLLRPRFLRDARDARARGELTPGEFKAAEDRAVREAVAMQEELGLPVVNDGEMRRESFQSELTAACGGFTGVDVNAWLWGEWHSSEMGDVTIARPEELAVIAPVRKRRNLAAEEFTFLRGCTSRQVKVTLPSPSLFASLWSPRRGVRGRGPAVPGETGHGAVRTTRCSSAQAPPTRSLRTPKSTGRRIGVVMTAHLDHRHAPAPQAHHI